MKKVPVSVVIPHYNNAGTIERAVMSIAGQTWKPMEVIIVDDCSTDKSSRAVLNDICQKYQETLNLVLIKNNKNKGPGASRNIGWNSAKGDYVAFLDSDDAWNRKKLEIQYGYMKTNPNVDFTCHDNLLKGQTKDINERYSVKEISFNKLLYKNVIGTRTVMLKKSLENRFVKNKYHSEDYLLWLDIAYDNNTIRKLNIPLSYSFSHPFLGEGLSGNLLKMYKGELDSYTRIFKEKKISVIKYIIIATFSSIKFLRRLYIQIRQKVFGV
ncbi:glycosyltransferase [Halobacillus litoralis]|uniref:Glycosyltransferase n=1 Tax=Halobacillus litoralis TaxID=45668 RepID=A0A845DUV8_9BACI|nr:glycosyltransferase family 2 protein [Halobacillus litoralis]MYL20102.1 glycosyltransferase [Halobacillus litoralis]